MAKTLLDGVNQILIRSRVLKSTTALTSLTDASKQNAIDIAVQVWNEAVSQLYNASSKAQPQEMVEDTIDLVDGTRSYALPAALNQFRWPLVDESQGTYIVEFPGGYEALRNSQPQPDNYTGVPNLAAISPIDGTLYMDRIPTATEDGREFRYFYDKDLELTLAADTFPFDDDVFRAMVPVVAEYWQRVKRQDFDPNMFGENLGDAARRLTKQQVRTSW